MASHSREDGDGTACDKCGAPASWADTTTSNLSWEHSLHHLLDTYLLSPRMWPIGYIARSPYSPLRLEMEMPDRTIWRDAFEDLLALESGAQMISLERRKKQAEFAKRQWYSRLSREILDLNDRIRFEAKYKTILERMHELALRRKWIKASEGTGEGISDQETHLNQMYAYAKKKVEGSEKRISGNQPASAYKMRGQWMVSLVSSGALPDWCGWLSESSEGYEVELSKRERNPEDGSFDGAKMTEYELNKQFCEGIPMETGAPEWSTRDGHYPEPEIIPAWLRDVAGEVNFQYRPSILSQLVAAERTKSGNQNLSTKVVLTTVFTDGATEVKEIVDDCCQVMEENERVYTSMSARNTAIDVACERARHDLALWLLRDHDKDNDLD